MNSVSHIPVSNECYDIDIAVNDRNSQDTIVDARDIIDICIGNKLRILNGRTLGDSKGKYTCYKPVGCGVIDYFMVSESLMSQILYMTVSDFITDFSDCHCKLSLKLLASFERKKVTQNLRDMPCRYMWTEQSHSFPNPLIKQSIEQFMGKEIDLNDHFIEAAVDELDEIFHKAADISLKKMKTKKRNKVSQKWFDLDLNVMKRKVDEKAKRMARYPNDPYIRCSFFKSYKIYAKLRKSKKREFKQALISYK